MDRDELQKLKLEKVKSAREIHQRHLDAGSEMDGDDLEKFNALMAEAEQHSQAIQRDLLLDSYDKQAEREDEVKERRTASRLSPPASVTRDRRIAMPTSEDWMTALQGWVAAGSYSTREHLTERHYEAAERCRVNLEAREFRIKLPNKAPSSLAELAEMERRVVTVALESPDTDGGINTVADEMMRPLERALLAFGGMRQSGATILRTATGADLPIPTTDDTSNSGAILGEAVEHTELDPTFSQLVLNSFKYTSRRVGMSVEFLQDNAINAAGIIGSMLGERIGRATNAHFTTGTGSAQPNGVVTAAADSGVDLASETQPTYRELMDIKHSVDPAYRARGARWMFNDTMLKEIKKIIIPQFSGDTAGMPLWRQGMITGEPDTIDGDPYVINQDMPTADAESPNVKEKAILYGDFSKYLIRDVRDVTLVRLDERYAELGVVAFLAFSRHDGDLLDAGTGPVKFAESA